MSVETIREAIKDHRKHLVELGYVEKMRSSLVFEQILEAGETIVGGERHRGIGKSLLILAKAAETERTILVESYVQKDLLKKTASEFGVEVSVEVINSALRGKDLRTGVYLDEVKYLDSLELLKEFRIPVWGGVLSLGMI